MKLHELTKKQIKIIQDYGGDVSPYTRDDLDKTNKDWLKEKAKDIEKYSHHPDNPVRMTLSGIQQILGLKEESLEEKLDTYIISCKIAEPEEIAQKAKTIFQNPQTRIGGLKC